MKERQVKPPPQTDENSSDVEDVSGGAKNGPAAPVDENGGEVTISRPEYEELIARAEEFKDLYLRTAADFDNFRKRMEKEREDIVCFANERLIADLLPILDNLDRALSSADECASTADFLTGVRMISSQLHEVLKQCGLEPLEAVGVHFDPNVHEAVGVLPAPGHEDGTVVAELQKGYRLKGKVVRPSMVHVAGGSDDGSAEGDEG